MAWSYQTGDQTPDSLQQNPWLRMTRQVPDQRGFAFDGDRVWTVAGLASMMRVQFQPQFSGTALLALDRATGKVMRRLEPKDIDDSLASAVFQGTPINADGRILVLMRRNQLSGFQDSFLVSIDAQTGRPVWRRYLSSAATLNRTFRPTIAQMIMHDGRIYVADSLGSTACLDARTGMVFWLAVMPDFQQAADSMADRPWIRPNGENTSWRNSLPVLVDAGLVVPGLSSSMLSGATLMDPQTGKVLRQLHDADWTQADYFMSAGNDVLIVGATLRLMDGKTLTPRWSRRLGDEQPAAPQGRAVVTQDRVFVPLGDGLAVVGLADGVKIDRQPLPSPGNLLVLDDQLIVADNQNVFDYMDWSRAETRLQKALAMDAQNPRPALALAYLGMTAGHTQAVAEGVDRALAMLTRDARGAIDASPRQHEVFTQLLVLGQNSLLDNALRRGIFDKLESAAAGPADQVAYHLARGDLAVELGNPSEAVDHYQSILTDPALASQVDRWSDGLRQSGLVARSRLDEIIRKAGSKAYERYDVLASQRLAELLSSGADAQAFLELARQYPLAQAVPQELQAAAASLEKAGNLKNAIFQLRRAATSLLLLHPADLAQSRPGSSTEALLRWSHQTRRAIRWLERVRPANTRGLMLQLPRTRPWPSTPGRRTWPGCPPMTKPSPP